MRLAPLALLLLLPQDPADCVSTEHGFKIRAPGAPWSLAEIADPPDARFAVKIARADGGAEFSVTVYVLDAVAGVKDAASAAALAEKRFAADAKCSAVKRDGDTVRFDYDADAKYTLRQRYFVQHDAIYMVQCAAPADRFAKEEKSFAAVTDTFAFVALDPKAREHDARLRALVKRCGSQVDFARDWKDAARRAAADNRLVLVVFERYRGVPIDPMALTTTFMDHDVVELVRERFVPLLVTDRIDAPFEDPKVFGLGPSTFGQGLLFATADGRVVAEGVSITPHYVYARAGEVLAKHPGGPPKNPDDAEERLRRGDLDAALRLLDAPKTPREWRLKGTLLRRLRRGDDALAALEKAGDETLVEQALVHIRCGRFPRAEELLNGRMEPDARFWRAVARGMRLGIAPIRNELDELTVAHPDSPWAWRAAAMLRGTGLLTGLDPILWPDGKILAAAAPAAPERIDDARRAEREAIDYLVKTQFPNGSWPIAMLSLTEPDGAGTVAVTAICATALLPHAADKNVAAAVERALAYVARADLRTRPERLFDYTIWAQIFALRALARAGGNRAAMNRLVAALRDGRHPGGGWAYVRMKGYDDNSIGFVTAAALCALREAKAAGADVPDDMIAKAADVLASLRRQDGAFGYMVATGKGAGDAESSLRSPLCAMALLRAGKGDADGVRASLDVYLKHREHVRKERGKVLCHTGPEGHASYYLLFGYAFAAEALQLLPRDARARRRAALLDDVLFMRTADGAFCDNAGMGRAYGAGMALQALRPLAE